MSRVVRFACVALAGLMPAAALADTVTLQGDVLDLAVATSASDADRAVLGGRAALSAKLRGFGANVRVGFEGGADDRADDAGRSPTQAWTAARWTSGSVGLGAAWAPSPKASFEAQASDWVRSDLALGNPAWSSGSNARSRAREGAARVAATLSPFSTTPLSLQVSGEASRRTQETAIVEDADLAPQDLTRSGSRVIAADLRWTPRAWLTLDGGWKAETVDASRRDDPGTAASFAYVAPRLGGVVAPWREGRLRVNVEQTVPSLSDDLTTRLGQLTETLADGTVRLDKERRIELALEQRLPADVSFSATLTAASLHGPAAGGGVSALAFDAGGDRRQVEAAISAPVRLASFSPFTLKARAAWRSSMVGDPVTGGERRISGEAPYDAALSIGGGGRSALRWEVAAHAVGASTSYQAGQVSGLSATAGLGGSITYRPGPLSVSLELVNVIGGDRSTRDTYFDGSRLAGTVDRVEETRGANRAFRIKLSRAL